MIEKYICEINDSKLLIIFDTDNRMALEIPLCGDDYGYNTEIFEENENPITSGYYGRIRKIKNIKFNVVLDKGSRLNVCEELLNIYDYFFDIRRDSIYCHPHIEKTLTPVEISEFQIEEE